MFSLFKRAVICEKAVTTALRGSGPGTTAVFALTVFGQMTEGILRAGALGQPQWIYSCSGETCLSIGGTGKGKTPRRKARSYFPKTEKRKTYRYLSPSNYYPSAPTPAPLPLFLLVNHE